MNAYAHKKMETIDYETEIERRATKNGRDLPSYADAGKNEKVCNRVMKAGGPITVN